MASSGASLKINTSLIIFFAVLQVFDGILTYFGIRFSLATEANPILNYAAEKLPLMFAIIALKFIIVLGIFKLFILRKRIAGFANMMVLSGGVVFYCCVVFNNAVLVFF